MIIIDGIIEKLQNSGGITTYFKELRSCFDNFNIEYNYLDYIGEGNDFSKERSIFRRSRFLERYRDVSLGKYNENMIFHSSYYRLPDSRIPKIVTTVHDFTYERYVKGAAKVVHSWQKYRAIENSDIVICVSNSTANDLLEYCPIDESRIRIVHNGVSDIYHPTAGVVWNSSCLKNVLFVGSRAGYKNFDMAVRAVSELADFTLDIVGGGELKPYEIDILNKNLSGRYKFLGRLTDEELNSKYNSAYALLYPSSYEGFGIPILEAMRAGCPVISVYSSSIPEVAGGAAILVDCPTVDNFKSALEKLSSNRNVLIDAGYQQAKKFSWNKCFQETLNVYRELL